MSAEETVLLTQILAEVRTLQAMVAPEPKKPGLTVPAFAKAAGLSVSTVERKLKRGELYRQKGRIPYSQLTPYLS